MKLNIYEGGNVSKTYETDTYDLMFGTVEDISDKLLATHNNPGKPDEVPSEDSEEEEV